MLRDLAKVLCRIGTPMSVTPLQNLLRKGDARVLTAVVPALSVWVPLYGGTPRVRLPDELIAHGRVCNGATRLRFRDGTPPLENLAILQSDLDSGIRRLERAGVRFSDAMLEQAPRRVPRVLPPTV